MIAWILTWLWSLGSTRISPKGVRKNASKSVCSWLGNSPDVANKHYAMTMQTSFDRAVVNGAKIVGVTAQVAGREVVDSKTPLNPPPTMQDILPLNQDTKKADAENPTNNWVCLTSALYDLPLSSPTRT